MSLNSHLTLWRVARGGSHAWPARVQVVSDDYVDLLVSLLWNVDSISSQAHLSGTRVQRAAFGCGPGRLRVGSRKHCGDWDLSSSADGADGGVGHSTSIVGLEELQASWKPQPAAGLSHSEPPRPRVSSVSRSLTEADDPNSA